MSHDVVDCSHAPVMAKIVAAAREVYRVFGPGFEEPVYQRELAHALRGHSLAFSREVWVDVSGTCHTCLHTGRKRVDFVIGTPARPRAVLVDIKAQASLEQRPATQTLVYPALSDAAIALLINFGSQSLEIRRVGR